ncbi:MAG: 2-C-methyl-D-erythritol 4-phosphate cytidylyltransferase [Acidimicrobiaceae bacterium]|nr:2-C-methyl-D-erythritol 4-phosphate cytidylyltransferase [Acidimicrobiaceae bacterium]
MTIRSAAIVVSAGIGIRFGGLKQLAVIGDRRVVDVSISIARKCVDYVVCVKVPDVDFGELEADLVVEGGATRTESVRAGLAKLPNDIKWVLVHDAARPLASAGLYERVLGRLEDGAPAVVPVLGIADTVKEVVGNKVVSTLDRSRLFRVQTPQGFQRSILELAYQSHTDATDDSQMVEQIGVAVEAILGDESNFKITTSADLERARNMVRDRGIF